MVNALASVRVYFFCGLQFSECWWKWKICISHYEKNGKKTHLRAKLPKTDRPHKVWVSIFLSVNRNRKFVSAIMEIDYSSVKTYPGANLQLLTPPPKFGSWVFFWVLMEMETCFQPLWKNGKMTLASSSKAHPRAKFPITNPQSLGLWFSECQ